MEPATVDLVPLVVDGTATTAGDIAVTRRTPPAGQLAPGAIGSLVGACKAALDEAASAEHWTAAQRRAGLETVEQAKSVLAALTARLLTAEQQAGTWALRGERDLAAWAGRVTQQGRGGGCAQVGQAATLAAMPAVAEALVDGPVTTGHLQQLTKATTNSPTLAAHLASPQGQADVVELARQLDAGLFGKELAHQAARLDPASQQRGHDEQRATRYLNLTHARGGTLLKGQFDTVAGNIVQRALDALCPQPGADDDRGRGQRQADALATIAQQVIADKDVMPASVAPPQVMLLIREETWAALRAPRPPDSGEDAGGSDPERQALPGPGSTRDVLTRLTGVPPISDEDGNLWPPSEVARTLCDCQITRIVVDEHSIPIDEGRTRRLFTPTQRRAVIARDGGGCALPGCTIPARYTQLHHITWWSHGGQSNLVDGMQACDHHHHYIHDRDIHITRNRHGQYVFTYPDGRLLPGSAQPDPPQVAVPCPAAGPGSEAEPCPATGRSEAEPGPPASYGSKVEPSPAAGVGLRRPAGEPPTPDPAPPPPDQQLQLWSA